MGALLQQFMNKYAYTDFHELNADWLIKTLMEMINQVENFVSLNAIKYADPIQWNIVSQYEKNTVVIDPLTGTAYISVQPVPSGVALTRTEYWTVVFDLGSFVVRAAKNFSNRYEAETTLTATFPTTAGDWLVWGDTLYEALVNITAGDQYVVDSNIMHITMEEVVDALAQAIDAVDTKVGDLNDLTTSVTTSVVLAINSVLNDLNTTIGDITNLITSDTSDIVNAINSEVTDRTNADDALEALIKSKIAIDATNPPTGYTAMIANDSSVDNTAALQALIDDFMYVYMPEGTFYFANNIALKHGDLFLFGAGSKTVLKVADSDAKSELFIIIPSTQEIKNVTFKNFVYDGNKTGRGISQDLSQQSFITCFTVSVYNVEDIVLDGLVMHDSPGFVCLFAGHSDGSDMTQYFTRNITVKYCKWYDNDAYIGTSGAENVTIEHCIMYHNGRENLCFDNNSLNCVLRDSYIGSSYGGIGMVGIGTCTGVVVANCQFDRENDTTATAKYRNAITVSNSFGASMTFDIHDCNIRNCPNCGIFLEYDPNINTSISGNLENIIFKNCGKSVISEIPYDKGIIKASLLYGAYEIDNQQNGNIIFDVLHGIWSGTANSYVYTGSDMRSTFTIGNYHRMGTLDSYNEPRTQQAGYYHIHYEADLAWAASTPPDISDNKQFKLNVLLNGSPIAADQHYSYLGGHYVADIIRYCGPNELIEFFITDFNNTSPVMIQSKAAVEYVGNLDPYITDLLF